MNKPILPAATVVVVRETNEHPEVLLLRRNPELKFAGNCWGFPGGKTDARELEITDGNVDHANQLAGVRECKEETGIDISSHTLLPISHWTTPNIHPKRFATQFYLCLVPNDSSVVVDQSEIVDYKWLTAQEALTLHHSGGLHIMPPTYVTLFEIAKRSNYLEVHKYYEERGGRAYNPRPTMHSKTMGTFLYEGDSGYENNETSLSEHLNRCESNNGILDHLCNLDD